MTSLEYTLCCDHPFGLHRVRALCTSVATQVYQCIQHLERLNPSQCKALYERFDHLQTAVASEVYPHVQLLEGPYIIPLEEAGRAAEAIWPTNPRPSWRTAPVRAPMWSLTVSW